MSLVLALAQIRQVWAGRESFNPFTSLVKYLFFWSALSGIPKKMKYSLPKEKLIIA